jgi:SAM-dependent methyltransferase
VQEDPEQARLMRVRELAAEAVAHGDGTGWFEKLYSEAETGATVVPWADGIPNPYLVNWTADRSGDGKRALVVGCGLGYDAEFLASLGFAVTAFDIAPSAIAAAKRENPGSPVEYAVADLLDLPAEWIGAFDLVVEIFTLQPLYGQIRDLAIAAVHRPVAPGGTLLIIARATNEQNPVRDPEMMPWPLTRRELETAAGPLSTKGIRQFTDNEDPPKLRWLAEFTAA